MQQANLFQLLFFLDTWKTLLTAWQWQTSITVCFLKPRSLFLSITELFIFQKAFQSCVTKDSLCMRLNMVIQVCFSLARAHTHTNWCDLMVTDSTVELSSGLQCWSPTTSGSQYFPSLHYCSPESSWICFIGFLSIPLWVDCVGWTRLQESEQFLKKKKKRWDSWSVITLLTPVIWFIRSDWSNEKVSEAGSQKGRKWFPSLFHCLEKCHWICCPLVEETLKCTMHLSVGTNTKNPNLYTQ